METVTIQSNALPENSAARDPFVSSPAKDGSGENKYPLHQKGNWPEHKHVVEVNIARHAVSTDTATYFQRFPPLELVTRPRLTTEEAAYYLNRKPQTLRAWACLESGPIRPIRIGGRLAWETSAIKALLGLS